MDLYFDLATIKGYKSASQKARVLTEDWARRNLFCASCARNRLEAAPGNTEVFDFVCGRCRETYQLKSRRTPLRDKILDSAYGPMMDSIKENRAPNLLLLHYDAAAYCAQNLIIVPRFFLSTSCIEARKPLSGKARRAGWIGCNIVLKHLPPEARIRIIKDRRVLGPDGVRKAYERFRFLADAKSETRGWTADVLRIVRDLDRTDFVLEDVYAHEDELEKLHPLNRHIRPKIRQQLQVLRDRGVLEFKGRGRYRMT